MLGYYLGEKIDLFTTTPAPEQQANIRHPSGPRSIPSRQRNFLIIGLDYKKQETAQLQSVWLAVYTLEFNRIIFMPIFPNPEKDAFNQQLAAAFRLDAEDQPNEAFFRHLEEVVPWWDGYVLFDHFETITLIDRLDEGMAPNMQGDGLQMVSHLPVWTDDPQARVRWANGTVRTYLRGLASPRSTTPTNFQRSALGWFLCRPFNCASEYRMDVQASSDRHTKVSVSKYGSCTHPTGYQNPLGSFFPNNPDHFHQTTSPKVR